MTLIVWVIFSKIGLNEKVIKEHTFAWFVFLSMSLYRILPLIATMLEGHSIGYNFILPLSTYGGETLLYLISTLAFYLAIKQKKPLPHLKNILFRCGFYEPTNNKTLWAIGIFGFLLNIYTTITYIEIGNVVGKLLIGFTFLQYAPILICFPTLLGNNNCNKVVILKKSCVFYIILLIVFSFARNTRVAMLEPIGTFALLLFLSYINIPKTHRNSINKKIIIIGLLSIVFLVPLLNDISLAMLYNRKFRTNENRVELFIKTFDTFRDEKKMDELRSLKEKVDKKEEKNINSKTWTETYVKNFALNRYCNLKVTDNTLYHAKKVGFGNKQMLNDLWMEIVKLLPTPILKFLGVSYDKNVRYSRGDMLKALSENRHPMSWHLITSNLADGLVTFGYWYFPIEFILCFIRFLFLDTLLLRYRGKIYYSIFGLISIFTFLGMFSHAGGCCDILNYILRIYWQDVILFIVGFTIFKKISII